MRLKHRKSSNIKKKIQQTKYHKYAYMLQSFCLNQMLFKQFILASSIGAKGGKKIKDLKNFKVTLNIVLTAIHLTIIFKKYY